MFYGRGAGRLPTASAVVADVIECVMHLDKIPHLVPWIKTSRQLIRPHADCPVRALLRLSREIPAEDVSAAFSASGMKWLEEIDAGEWVVQVGLNGSLTEGALNAALSAWDGQVVSRIRFF